MNFYWVYAIVAMFLLTMVMVGDSSTQRQVQWPDFKEMAEKGQITRVSHDGARANLYFTEAVRDSLTGGKSDPQLLQALYAGADASMNIPKGEAYQTELKGCRKAKASTCATSPQRMGRPNPLLGHFPRLDGRGVDVPDA